MKGLLRKDFYLLLGYNRMLLPILLLFIVLSCYDGNDFFSYYPCILGSVLSVNLLAYDEAEHWNSYCDTLPVTRKQYVSEKYLMGVICAGVIFLLSAAAAAVRLSRGSGLNPADFGDQIAVLATLAPLPTAVCLPLMFKYGTQKGRIAFYVVLGLFCTLSVFLTTPVSLSPAFPVFLLPLLSLALFAASWLLSIRFYQKREI